MLSFVAKYAAVHEIITAIIPIMFKNLFFMVLLTLSYLLTIRPESTFRVQMQKFGRRFSE